jgi:hypothetical protein
MTTTGGQATAMLHALYGPRLHRAPTHAEQRGAVIDELDRDDREVAG